MTHNKKHKKSKMTESDLDIKLEQKLRKNLEPNQEKQYDNKLQIVCMSFMVYLLYVIGIWMCDAFDLACYFTKLPQVTVISRIAVAAILMGACFFVRKKVTVRKINKDLFFYVAMGFILLFGIFKGIIPDTSCDVQNYHILAQQPGFRSYFNQYVASGDLQLFGFILPDRLFYLFRLVLGYRMGTILNSIIMILVYLQVIDLLRIICGEKLIIIRNRYKKTYKISFIFEIFFNESVLAFLIIFFHDFILQTATYMVDILPIPFALEMLRLLIKENKSDNKLEIVYFALLTGIFFGMKMTNIVYIIPMLVIYILRNRKMLSIPLGTVCAVICALPASVYLLYDTVSTGNPVFPYFNTLFQSPYFNIINFKDNRWGPSNLKETILWPLYMIFKPEYRQSEIPNIWPYAFLGGLSAVVYYVYKAVMNKLGNNKSELSLVIIFIASLYLWAISTGHIRYFIFGSILNGILLIMLLSAVIEKKHIGNGAVAFILLAVLSMQPAMGYLEDAKGTEWSWRSLDKDYYLDNVKYVLRDYQFATAKQADKIDLFLMNQNAKGSVAYLIQPDSPIIYYPYIKNHIQGAELQESFMSTVSQYIIDDAGVYDIGDQGAANIEKHIETLTENGYYIEEIEYLDSVFVDKNTLLIYKIGKLQKNERNIIYYANIGGKDQISINDHNNLVSLKASIGLTDHLLWFSKPLYFSIEASDKNKSKVILKKEIDEGLFYNIEDSLDLTGLTGNITLKFVLKDKNGIVLDNIGPYRLAIINPQLTQ